MQNPYETLGVTPQATFDEIKKAYRRLAMKHHPDRGEHSAQRFQDIAAAYEIIGNPKKRAVFDRQDNSTFSFHDMFSEHFSQPVGGNLQAEITIDLLQSVTGATVQVERSVPVSCGACAGSGAANNKRIVCFNCKGDGHIARSVMGFTLNQLCPTCQGTGQTPEIVCAQCLGTGQVMQSKRWNITVPAGIDQGNQLRLRGEGLPGAGENGDLFVGVSIAPHPLYERKGRHLQSTLPLRFSQAALGDTIEMPWIDGSVVAVGVPAGTQHGSQIVVEGKGARDVYGKQGDLYVNIVLETPVNLNKQQRDLLQRLDNASRPKHNPVHANYLTKIKKLFGQST